MAISTLLKNQHLLWRTGFGALIEHIPMLKDRNTAGLVGAIFNAIKSRPTTIEVANNVVDGLSKGISDIIQQNKKPADMGERRQQQQMRREALQNLNIEWFNTMVESKDQLTEKVSLFWHGHFACRVINVYYQQLLLNTIRTNALGNFGDLLREVSKSAAIINFLNNQQNRKTSPNENFAREIMELFTLGRGNYTETDIKEAARAFTGWTANVNGQFVFVKKVHDAGSKTFLGQTGNWNGDDIIDILLQQKQTARFIVVKIWKFFVNETTADGDNLNELTDYFYTNNYDIKGLLKKIFLSTWFYEEENMGTKIKSPVELLVGIQRALPMELENEDILLYLQKALGQILFYPPNVAGWPGGKQWIDSSSLMLRLRIPRLIFDQDEFAVNGKADDDVMGGQIDEKQKARLKKIIGGRVIKATIEWTVLEKTFANTSKENLLKEVANHLLVTPQLKFSLDTIYKYQNKDNRLDFIKSAIINLMSTPEYQMC
jgi:uncharacterized protein (DUF1800 family)